MKSDGDAKLDSPMHTPASMRFREIKMYVNDLKIIEIHREPCILVGGPDCPMFCVVYLGQEKNEDGHWMNLFRAQIFFNPNQKIPHEI